MLDEMRAWNWVFPTGAILTAGGVFLYALVEHLSFGSTEGLGYAILSQSFFPALLLGNCVGNRGVISRQKAVACRRDKNKRIDLLGCERCLFALASRHRQRPWLDVYVYFSSVCWLR